MPLPIGNGEQRLNALPVVQAGGGMCIADAELTPEYLRDEVVPLPADGPRLAAMMDAALRVGHRDAAARRVADVAASWWPGPPGGTPMIRNLPTLPPELAWSMVGTGELDVGDRLHPADRGAMVSSGRQGVA